MAEEKPTKRSPRFKDLTGQKFGKLTIIRLSGIINSGRSGHKRAQWECSCECGGISLVTTNNIKNGHTRSCGCVHRTDFSANKTHGLKGTREYKSWEQAKQRCFNPNNHAFKYYGGRGITMSEDWRKDFTAFLRDMGPRPSNRSLDRINGDGNYEKGNCRWATNEEQSRNRKKKR